ncbi:hypothetical protein DL764_000795 [Monosporascus ibericus]|uniref:Nudix hydrolase domain-containing protein n=1 Tax=Monosporascus ibericus TaxID=155417 RepID=A0A4Q4TXF9_9PEZI|nr:hypothetical protein DL764_000795 [Monosporascus ibericus]
MPWTSDFEISKPDERPRTVKLLDSSNGRDTSAACNAAFAKVIQAAHDGPQRVLFGIACRRAHMTVHTRTAESLKVWVPRRSAHLKTWPGKLDTTVAGGVRAEESALDCIMHEADEEASLPEDLARKGVKPCGAITYLCESGAGSGGEFGLMVPDVLYVFDLEVGEDVVPKPQDDEVEAFYVWDVQQVKEALRREEFKTNCASVMIDFFIRHGIITDDNEPDYVEIVTRLHRVLPVPLTA